MKSWVKFYVDGHNCGAFHPFCASSLRSAESFQLYWGGTIRIA